MISTSISAPGTIPPTGSSQPLVDNYPDLPRTNIIYLNLEHPAQTGVYRSYFGRFGGKADKYGNVTDPYVPTNWDSQGREVSLLPDSPVVRRAWTEAAMKTFLTGPARFTASDVSEPHPFAKAGGSVIQDVETNLWYHTSGDTADTISPEALQRAATFSRDFIDRMDRSSRAEVRGEQR